MITIVILCSIALLSLFWLVHEGWLGYPAARYSLSTLTRKEQAILQATSEALFPAGGSLPSGEQAGVVPYLDRMLADLPRRQRVLIRVLLLFVEHGSILFGPIRRRITRQSVEQRMSTLRGWEVSNLYLRRLSFLSLRTLLTLAYFGHPEVTGALLQADA